MMDEREPLAYFYNTVLQLADDIYNGLFGRGMVLVVRERLGAEVFTFDTKAFIKLRGRDELHAGLRDLCTHLNVVLKSHGLKLEVEDEDRNN